MDEKKKAYGLELGKCGADEAETGSHTFSWVTCPACLELKGRRKTGISKKDQKVAP